MKTTRMIPIVAVGQEEKPLLDRLMQVYGSAERYSYNRLKEGSSAKDIIKILQPMFKLNKRFSEDAVLKAQMAMTSQETLLPMQLEDTLAKIQKTEKKIDEYQTGKKKPKKVDLETCLKGLSERLAKLQEKADELQVYVDTGTLPPAIFGGKTNFYKRLKGKISNKEWRELRSNSLYSRGDRSKRGNLNIRLVYQEKTNQFVVEIANPLLQQGSKNAPRITIPVAIPEKYEKEIINIVMGEQVGINTKGKPIIDYIPYTIELKRKGDKYILHLSYEEKNYGNELKYNESILADRIAGIDINIDRIAVSILSCQGNFLKSKVFYCHELEYVRKDRRNNIVGETMKKVFNWLLEENVGAIVIEDITLKQQHDTDHKFNRLTHNFKKKTLHQSLVRNALRLGLAVKKVNPAYTSVIGRYKYMKKYGLSVHESASFVIGRRGLGFEETLPKELIQTLKQVVKPHTIGLLGSMEESYKQTKSGKKERQYLGMLLSKINNFKQEHSWSLWNIFHKLCWVKQYKIQLKEA